MSKARQVSVLVILLALFLLGVAAVVIAFTEESGPLRIGAFCKSGSLRVLLAVQGTIFAAYPVMHWLVMDVCCCAGRVAGVGILRTLVGPFWDPKPRIIMNVYLLILVWPVTAWGLVMVVARPGDANNCPYVYVMVGVYALIIAVFLLALLGYVTYLLATECVIPGVCYMLGRRDHCSCCENNSAAAQQAHPDVVVRPFADGQPRAQPPPYADGPTVLEIDMNNLPLYSIDPNNRDIEARDSASHPGAVGWARLAEVGAPPVPRAGTAGVGDLDEDTRSYVHPPGGVEAPPAYDDLRIPRPSALPGSLGYPVSDPDGQGSSSFASQRPAAPSSSLGHHHPTTQTTTAIRTVPGPVLDTHALEAADGRPHHHDHRHPPGHSVPSPSPAPPRDSVFSIVSQSDIALPDNSVDSSLAHIMFQPPVVGPLPSTHPPGPDTTTPRRLARESIV